MGCLHAGGPRADRDSLMLAANFHFNQTGEERGRRRGKEPDKERDPWI